MLSASRALRGIAGRRGGERLSWIVNARYW